MRRFKVLLWSAAFLASVTLLAPVGPVSTAHAQVSIGIGIGGPPPVCPYGYYDYAPYACAPVGFYGPGYFYNGIFLGVGPWYQWGYRHGWGNHRFIGPGGGRYYGDGRGHHYARGHYYRPGYRGHGHRGGPRGEYRGGGHGNGRGGGHGGGRGHDGGHR
ncbi:hypothetical protein [Edaphobacter dinghuensis]|uniref:hypothetical protein n=1 Tax=Edaphobacter dinghuensis TaxID=1560005 RepID=UPI001E44CE95|nr:hypothetical protein [Edaphobacter dinghuensis]